MSASGFHRRRGEGSGGARARRQGALPDRSRQSLPENFTGHIRAVLSDGRVVEERQPHMRGGAHEPLTRADIEDKFVLNARHGGWQEARIEAALNRAKTLYDGALIVEVLRGNQ